MPHLVVAGFNTRQIRQILERGGAMPAHAWTARYLDAGSRGLIGFSDVAAVLKAAAETPDSHVLAASEQDGDIRTRLANSIKPYFRFRWLSNRALSDLKRNRFEGWTDALQPVLEEENEWRNTIRPSASGDALMLPRPSFDCMRQLDIWGASEAYGDPDTVRNSQRMIERFNEQHWRRVAMEGRHGRSSSWVDGQSLNFDHRGERHGVARFPYCWKYSYRIEDGFHFDVSHGERRAFKISGLISERRVQQEGYVNIDCHGRFRGEAA